METFLTYLIAAGSFVAAALSVKIAVALIALAGTPAAALGPWVQALQLSLGLACATVAYRRAGAAGRPSAVANA